MNQQLLETQSKVPTVCPDCGHDTERHGIQGVCYRCEEKCMHTRDGATVLALAARVRDLEAENDRLNALVSEFVLATLRRDEVNRELHEACEYALNNIDYLQKLFGKEGVADGVADRLREALKVQS